MSNSSVRIDFQAGGIAKVQQAFRGIEQTVARAEKAALKESQKASNDRVRIAQQEEKKRETEFAKLGKSAAKWEHQAVKETEKAEKEKSAIVAKAAKYRDTVQANSARMAARYIEQTVRAEEAASKRILQTRARIARSVGGSVGNTVGRLGNAAVSMGGAALALGGGFGIADTVQKSFAAQRSAAQLVNQVTVGGKRPDGANVSSIMGRAGAVAMSTGMDKNQVIEGSLAYARSARGGDFKGAMDNMEFFAKMSKTTGTDIGELASSAGILQSQNADLGKDPAKMRQMLLNAYAQSKMGSVSMTDAAKQFGVLGSTRGFYQGNEAQNQMTLMGLGQIAASGGVSGDVGTYIKDLSIEAGAKRRAKGHFVGLENMGVKYNAQGQMESPEQMIGAVLKSTKGDMSRIHDIFGNRGQVLFGELSKTFNDAGGGDKGVSAVQAQMKGVTGTTMGSKELDDQFGQVMSTNAEKFGVVTEKLKDAIESRLTPYLEKLGDKLSDPAFIAGFEKLLDGIVKVADFMIDNPFKSIGIVVLGAITKDLAAAAIGEAVKSTLLKLMGGGGGGGLPVPAGGGGASGNGVPVAGIALAAAWQVNMMKDNYDDQWAGSHLAADVRSGKVSAADAKKQLGDAQTNWSQQSLKDVPAAVARQAGFGGAIDSVFGTNLNAKGSQMQKDVSIANSSALAEAIGAAVAKHIPKTSSGDPASAPHRNQPVAAPARGGTQ